MTLAGTETLNPVVLEPAVSADVIPPFLRWAGGKRWLIPQILKLVGSRSITRYHEPFVGGGSVFFALPKPAEVFLSDLNEDLIEVYEQIRDRPEAVSALLCSYENSSACYYATRESAPSDPAARAARFIYLNHTSYNGIYRVNLKGEYNVPYGNRVTAHIPASEALKRASSRLSGVSLKAQDFKLALGDVRAGDLVFLDPPYTVAHNNNGFVKYNQHLFSFDDQRGLATVIQTIKEAGAWFILTNAAHKSIDELFTPLGRRLTISRRNSVGGKNALRGSTEEYLFTNLEDK